MSYIPNPDSMLEAARDYGLQKAQLQAEKAYQDKNYAQGSLPDYAASLGVSSGLAGCCSPTTTVSDYQQTAYDILEDMARRGMTRPHSLPEAEIQILSAFVLGYNSK